MASVKDHIMGEEDGDDVCWGSEGIQGRDNWEPPQRGLRLAGCPRLICTLDFGPLFGIVCTSRQLDYRSVSHCNNQAAPHPGGYGESIVVRFSRIK